MPKFKCPVCGAVNAVDPTLPVIKCSCGQKFRNTLYKPPVPSTLEAKPPVPIGTVKELTGQEPSSTPASEVKKPEANAAPAQARPVVSAPAPTPVAVAPAPVAPNPVTPAPVAPAHEAVAPAFVAPEEYEEPEEPVAEEVEEEVAEGSSEAPTDEIQANAQVEEAKVSPEKLRARLKNKKRAAVAVLVFGIFFIVALAARLFAVAFDPAEHTFALDALRRELLNMWSRAIFLPAALVGLQLLCLSSTVVNVCNIRLKGLKAEEDVSQKAKGSKLAGFSIGLLIGVAILVFCIVMFLADFASAFATNGVKNLVGTLLDVLKNDYFLLMFLAAADVAIVSHRLSRA